MKKIVVLAHNIRSTHNVGSILRSCDGFKVEKFYASGYTPYPYLINYDSRLPHIAKKLTSQISKSALGAEVTMLIEHTNDIASILSEYRRAGYKIIALEQHKRSRSLKIISSEIVEDIVMIVGEEVSGITADIIELTDEIAEIPMFGNKESFNVAVATAIALYEFRRQA